MLPQDNTTIVRTIFDSFNSRDFDRAVALVAPGAVFVDVAQGVAFHGPVGYRQRFQNSVSAYPDVAVEIANLFAGGDWVAVEYVSRGTNTGPLIGPSGQLPPTARRVEVRFCDVYQIKNGKVVLGRSYYDLVTMMRQLGQWPTLRPAGS
ncbi:MAG: ester cyclase [Chloroflexi bacterium]|nr:ester cyclase [Chloroflexota bacterium]MDA8187467.1 ester cyclase [Dehalococcoidales bacterium]